MLCDICKKRKASVFYNETVGAKTRTRALCAECAADRKKGGRWEEVGSVMREWGIPCESGQGLLDRFFPLAVPKGISPVRSCSRCGMTLADIATSGRVGCTGCYDTFGEQLRASLTLVHGNAESVGQSPGRYKERIRRAERIRELREKLHTAIASENYEEAVSLRDEIRTLEQEDPK